jgi:beta-mannanase
MSHPHRLARIVQEVVVLGALVSAGAVSAQGRALLGVYYGNQGWKMDQVRAMEAWQGKRHAVVHLFTDWCNRSKTMDNLFKQQLPNVWANGNVPVISWEPYLCSPAATPADVEVRAARGDYDAYLAGWADRLKAFVAGPDGALGTSDDRRTYLRLAHEMNGDWYPWGAAVGANSPAHYLLMWQRVRGIFWGKGLDARTVQWIWAVNHDDVGAFRAEDYYPGDAYVDWIGIDGYNWGTSQTWSSWRTPAEVFGAMAARLRGISTRPLALTETASTSAAPGGPSVAAKSQWITQFFAYVPTIDARMVVWFNEDKETDWSVFGGAQGDETYRSGRTSYKAYGAYRSAVKSPALLPSVPADPRLLDETTFGGLW